MTVLLKKYIYISDFNVLINSDAHYLWQISEIESFINISTRWDILIYVKILKIQWFQLYFWERIALCNLL
jgi:hypothetical protein